MGPSKSLLDLMPDDERKKAIERGKKRLERNKSRKGVDVSPEIYLVSEFGYYFGWEGVLAIKRGYIESDGNRVPFDLDEAIVLLEGARKVWNVKLAEQAQAHMIGGSFKLSKGTFEEATQPYRERSAVTE